MCQKALDMERSHGEEGAEGKCRKDKGHDLDLLQSSCEYSCAVCRIGVGNNRTYCNGCIRNAAGYNDWHPILIIVEHGAWEMPALLAADRT